MPRTLPTPPQAVNAASPWRRRLLGVGREQLLIWGLLGGTALLGFITGLENWLAHLAYQPDITQTWGATAWWLRQWGAALPGYVAVAALLALFWPKLWQQRPLVYQSCAILALTALLGAGLINQVLVQELADRHRPRETILVGQAPQNLPAELTGNSMPSGHAAMGFVLAAPYFVLRRRRPNYAKLALGLGLGAGAVVGAGRVVLGAHYLSDILIAGALALSTASLLAPLLEKYQRIPRRFLLVGFALAGAGVVLGNYFKLTLTAMLPQPLPRLEIPCEAQVVPAEVGQTAPVLTVKLAGYGAPVSAVKLRVTPAAVSLEKDFGFFHNLSCTATLALPEGAE